MIDRLQYIEQRKLEGLSLEEIQAELQGKPYEEIDVQSIRLKMQNLEQEVATLVAHFDQQDKKNIQMIKKNVSTESIALIQSLLLLIH